MENNVQEDYKSEILDIVRSNASPGIMRDKLEDYHENDLAEVFPELTLILWHSKTLFLQIFSIFCSSFSVIPLLFS